MGEGRGVGDARGVVCAGGSRSWVGEGGGGGGNGDEGGRVGAGRLGARVGGWGREGVEEAPVAARVSAMEFQCESGELTVVCALVQWKDIGMVDGMEWSRACMRVIMRLFFLALNFFWMTLMA